MAKGSPTARSGKAAKPTKGKHTVKGQKRREAQQAPALSKAMWRKWLDFVHLHAGPRIFLAIWLTGEFGLRVREALCLQRTDLRTEADCPYVDVKGVIAGARKSPGRVFIRPASLKTLRQYLKSGAPLQSQPGSRSKAKPAAKPQCVPKSQGCCSTWLLPKSGPIFTARKKSGRGHLHYNAVYNQCLRLGPMFLKELEVDGAMCDQDVARVRPHSGRATFITQLMAEGHATSISLKAARHKPSSIKTHLRYGQLTLEDMRQALGKSSPPGTRCVELVRVRGGVLTEACQVDLAAAHRAIVAELVRRGAT